jgi:KUP system potassium uptake protein
MSESQQSPPDDIKPVEQTEPRQSGPPPLPPTDDVAARRRLLMLSLAALGVVYGDIGTSPLYTLRECFRGPQDHIVSVTSANVLGVLSLIFWSLLIVISVKYLVFILRADNRGEGGILALMALVSPSHDPTSHARKGVIVIGLFGAALLYANGILTPAVTVLSAVEGLTVAMPFVQHWVIPITLAILIALFVVQSYGTAKVGAVFGPVILLWFVTIGILGLVNIFDHPSVLAAISPHFAVNFFAVNGTQAFVIMGTVFLVVTGGEALYADLGHFGIQPIRYAWFAVVLPSLLLNYFGQGALLLNHPTATHPFFEMAPSWGVVPLVLLAAAAAAIASQAIITGAFSLTLQAIQLGYCPRMRVEHTSAEKIGQIYLPTVNWGLMIACLMLVLGFRTSSNLAAAYGVAITMTMVITTLLFFLFLRDLWKWSLPKALALCGAFLVLDLAYFGANVPKIDDGGWLPLAVAGAVYVAMSTWRKGRKMLAQRMRERLIVLELFLADLMVEPPRRVPGLAVFMSGNPVGTPPALRHNVIHNHILHETVTIVIIQTADVPHVPPSERSEVEEIGEGFWRVMLTYGFMDEPNVPLTLCEIKRPGVDFCRDDISYFLGRETLLVTDKPGMAQWREQLFVWMSRNSQTATQYFHLPAERVVEIGVQVEL